MLNLQGFTNDIVSAFKDTLPSAFEQALIQTFPEKSDAGNELAKNFGETVCDLLAEPLGERIAAAIDCYIRSASIKGNLLTIGTPFTQTATIMPINLGNPSAGITPNTLGIV